MSKSKDRDYVYVLRVVDKDMKSSHGFKYPRRGRCTAPDWDPYPECGHGLHGWLNGVGNPRISNMMDVDDSSNNWLIIKVHNDDLVRLKGKCKFRTGYVVFYGTRENAINYLAKKGKVTADTNWQTVHVPYHGTFHGKGQYVKVYGAEKLDIKISTGSEINVLSECRIAAGALSRIYTGGNCNIASGSDCVIKTGARSIIKTMSHSGIVAGERSTIICTRRCNVVAARHANVKTGSYSKIHVGSDSKVECYDNCTVSCGDRAFVSASINCVINVGDHSLVRMGYSSVIKTGKGTVIKVVSTNHEIDEQLADQWVRYDHFAKKFYKITYEAEIARLNVETARKDSV